MVFVVNPKKFVMIYCCLVVCSIELYCLNYSLGKGNKHFEDSCICLLCSQVQCQLEYVQTSTLFCRRIIHTVGPKYAVKYHTAAENALSHCYRSCLELLIENGLQRLGVVECSRYCIQLNCLQFCSFYVYPRCCVCLVS